jgi:beta-xylosidase
LQIEAIDPAHIAANGRRYLHYNGGYVVELNADGLSVKGSARKDFEAWPVPSNLRIVNDRQEVDFHYRLPGQSWKRAQESAEVAGLNHNVLGGFLDLRPALYACGSGHATFRSFKHVRQ